MALAHSPRIITDGLKLLLDAANVKSTSVGDIFYVGGTSDSDNSSSFTLNGLQAGDLVLYFSAEDASNVVTPAGASWTAIPGLGTQPDNDGRPSSAAFYVFATGTSVTASGLGTNRDRVRVMIAFRNVDTLNPFLNVIQNDLITNDTLPNPPSITTNTNNSMIVAVGLLDDEDIANSISPPTGYTTALNMDSRGGANVASFGGSTIMTAYKLLATAAEENPGAFTSSNVNGGDPNKGITIALRQNSSNIWEDISGNDNRVIGFSSGKRYFESYAGGVFDFYGTTDELYMSNSNDLAFINALLSINVWIYIDDLTNSFPINNKRGPTQLDNLDYSLEVSSDGKVRWIIDSDLVCDTATGLIEENTWYNLTATHDGNTAKIYINGVQSVSVSSNKSSISTDVNDIVSIGSAYSNYPNKVYAIGKIASIAMYSRALTPEDVLQNYDAIKGRFLNAGSPPIKIFSALQTLATTLASVSVPTKQNSTDSLILNDDDSVQSIIESAHSSFNVFAVVGFGKYAEDIPGRGVAGGMRTHTATGFNYNTSLSNILSTGNAIVEMSGGGRINPNLNVIDGKKWMAMAQFDGTNFDGILLWIFTGDSVNTAGTVTPKMRSVSNVKDIFYPEGSSSFSVDDQDYHHIYPIAIDPSGTITSNTTSGASGWNFSSESEADEILGYYFNDFGGRIIRSLSQDDGIWGFKIPGYVDGDDQDASIEYGMGNLSGNDDTTLPSKYALYATWNGVRSPASTAHLGFVFSGDA